MAPNAEDLAKRLAALSERFTALATTLGQAAQQLQAGTVPSEAVVDEIGKIRTDFVDVRHRVLEAARSLSIAVPAIAEVDSLRALEPMLEASCRRWRPRRRRRLCRKRVPESWRCSIGY